MTDQVTNQGSGTGTGYKSVPYQDRDGNEFTRLLRSLWRTRYRVLASLVIAALALTGFLTARYLAFPKEDVYQYVINFSFPSVEKQQYPNGTSFSITDITAPAIMESVYQQNRLSRYNISLAGFVQSVSVLPYIINADAIKKRYKLLLSNKKLTLTERLNIEKQMQAEWDKNTGKSAMITMVIRGNDMVSPRIAKKVVHDIIRQWSEISIHQLGVLNLPGGQEKKILVNLKEFSGNTPLLAMDMLYSFKETLGSRLRRMEQIPGIRTSRGAEGYPLSSLKRDVRYFDDYINKPLEVDIISNITAKEAAKYLEYFKVKYRDLMIQKKVLDEKATQAEKALNVFRTGSFNANTGPGKRNAGNPPDREGGTVTQINKDFLDRLLVLVDQNADKEFQKKLVTKFLRLKNSSTNLEIKASHFKRIVASLEKISTAASSAALSGGTQNNLPSLQKRLIEAARKINGYWEQAHHLQEQVSLQKVSYAKILYVPASINVKHITFSFFNKTTILFVISFLLFVGIVSMFLTLLWNRIKGKSE